MSRECQRRAGSRTASVIGGFAVVLLASGPALAAAGTAPPRHPAGQQLITVTASAYTATRATLSVYRWQGGRWVRVFGPWTARVGYHGIARLSRKREGDGRTPSGTYGFQFFFGVRANPEVKFAFRHAYRVLRWLSPARSAHIRIKVS